jgi:hypothetical protein
MDSFFARLVTPEGYVVARAALVDQYDWFTHASKKSHIHDIIANGLCPQPQIPPGWILPRIIGSKITCLSPHPKQRALSLSTGEEAFILAVAADHLPSAIGIDWSFGGWDAYCANYDHIPNAEIGQSFLKIVKQMESVIAYEPISPSLLRVFPKVTIDLVHRKLPDPSEWTSLLSTPLDRVHMLQPDYVGNVQV